MARSTSARNQLLGVGVYLLFGALLVGSTILLFLWMSNGLLLALDPSTARSFLIDSWRERLYSPAPDPIYKDILTLKAP